MFSYINIVFLLNILLKCSFVLSLSTYSNSSILSSSGIHCFSTEKRPQQAKHYTLEMPHPKDVKQLNRVHKIKGCTPEKIWFMSRHGTRYPGENKMDNLWRKLPMVQKRIVKNDLLCHKDHKLLKEWKMNATSSAIPCSLASQGYIDLHKLAKSYKKLFPTLFNKPYSPKVYKFVHSSAQRTKQSCGAFVQGIFNRKTMEKSKKHWTSNDTMLRPWSICDQFSTQLLLLDVFESEMDKFKNTKYVTKLQHDISKRLGMKTLRYHMIAMMWDECRYQHAYHKHKKSAWCAAFNVEQAIILEYLADLDLYYKYGPGFELAFKLPCTVIKSMVDTMTTDKSSRNKVTGNFAHAELMLMILTALGAKQDKLPLLASNFEQQSNRLFQSSKLAQYASNFAAVKYNCPSSSSSSTRSAPSSSSSSSRSNSTQSDDSSRSNSTQSYTSHSNSDQGKSSTSTHNSKSSNNQPNTKVLFLHNEKPIKMPWCVGGSVCTVDEILDWFNASVMQNCPYDICGKDFAESKGLADDKCANSFDE